MPRTKGSKNKVKAAGVDYENLIAAAQKEKEEAEAEVAKTNASIEELKTDLQSMKETLKMQKTDVKAAEKKLTKLEEKKAKADIAAEAEAKKVQAQEMINQLLANGMSADEILEKLK
jgi:chromosome segregation ATPase